MVGESRDQGVPSRGVGACEELDGRAGADDLLECGLEPLIGDGVETERRLAHLRDARLQRGRVLGVEPDVQAEPALHLPLGRRCQVGRADVVQPFQDVVAALQPDDGLLDLQSRAGRRRVTADAGERRDTEIVDLDAQRRAVWHLDSAGRGCAACSKRLHDQGGTRERAQQLPVLPGLAGDLRDAARRRSPVPTASADDLERELRRAALRDELGERVPVHEVGECLRENAVEAEALQLLGSPRVDKKLLFVDVGDVRTNQPVFSCPSPCV